MPATERILEFPGFVDVHVHFRDPGVPEAETTESGLAAARRGGFAAVVTMPNTEPPMDSPSAVAANRRDVGDVRLFSSACITRGRRGEEVADLEALAEAGAVFFTDDGSYVRDQRVLEEAMARACDLNMVVSQHDLAPGLSEAECIRRDLSVCRETGCRFHVQHISTAEGVELVRDAQKEGLPVSAEATPHHILLCRDDIRDNSPNYKMAPPLGTKEDRFEVRKAVKDGVLMFATDHAPHPKRLKDCPWEKAANGIVGLETAIPITYAVMVEEEGMDVAAWARAWHEMPLGLMPGGREIASSLRKTKVALGPKRAVDVSSFASLSRNCPYDGMSFTCWSCCDGFAIIHP